jgi:histidyl-tRNA synthetase
MKTLVLGVKGARDFYPEDMAVRSWLYRIIQEVSQEFGYQEYDGPFLERVDLYAAKSGEELVKEQSFVFPDRGGDLVALRPELTPSLARMGAQRQNGLVYPLRWWSFGPFWRYEQPQKGRGREFFQWNIDLIGAASPEGDAEIAAIGAAFFRRAGLKPEEVAILVNNRRLMDQQFQTLGIPIELRKGVLRLMDRREKMRPAQWEANALELGLTLDQFEGLKRVLADGTLWQQSDELQRFFKTIEILGASDFVRYDPNIIRGLDYYTGTVFEARDGEREFRSVFGGGRYDNLVAAVGGTPLPGVGFAMGDMVATLLLRKFGRIPVFPDSPAPVLVTVFDAERLPISFGVANELRQAGLKVACYPEAIKLERQFKFADKKGMRCVVVIGPDEAANGQVTLKDLTARTQQTLARADAAAAIYEILAGSPAS